MADEGFAKIHRKILKWEWYDDTPTRSVFIHLIIKANHEAQFWRGEKIEKGQHITSIKKIADPLGLSQMQVRRALKNLEKTGEIDIKTTNRFTMITLSEYSTYHQKPKKGNKQTTNEEQTNNNQTTTNKNEKNEKNDKKEKKDLYLDFVKLTKHEHEKLVKKFGEQGTKDRIWNLNDYGHRKKKKFNEYTDHYRTILNWEGRKNNGKDNRAVKRKPVEKAKSKSEGEAKRPTVITIED